MIIHEVTEANYIEEREKGRLQVQKKFDAWDKLGKVNISIDEFKKKAAYLLRDPTIWSYATLRDKQNKPLRPYYFQDNIMNDRHRFVHVSAANQIGKTWGAGIIKGIHHALHTNSGSVMLISRGEDQAKGILDEMKWMMRRAKLNYEGFEDEVANRFEYHIKSPDGVGVTPIRVFPPTPAILSFPSTLTIKDETGFWEKKNVGSDPIDYYQQCVEPRTNATKNWKHPFLTMGQIVSITNPNGQNGLAWWLRNNKQFHQYTYNWLANPENSYEEYMEKKETMNPIIFASTYAADYVSSGGGFITLDQYERFRSYNTPLVISPCSLFLGGDFASEEPKSKGTDWTVLYGVVQVPNETYPQFPRIRVVYRMEFAPRTKRETIYNEIRRIQNLPGVNIVKFAYDRVGVGDSVKRDLTARGILHIGQIEVLTYSLPNKSEVYLAFQTLFGQDMIEGTEIVKLKEQLLALKVEEPPGSPHIKVHHKTEGVKDDEPDALANACYVARDSTGMIHASFVRNEGIPSKSEGHNDTIANWVEENKLIRGV